MAEERSVLREVDAEAIKLARTLLRTARHGSLAVLNAETGAPGVSRVGVSTDIDGTPIVLISRLAPHTAALLKDGRCALLLGDPGKGDPLAHARLSIDCRTGQVDRQSPEHARLRTRYLNHQPKAGLYADLGDFRFFRLEPLAASLNGGFGKAYAMTPDHLLTRSTITPELQAREPAAVDHMNQDHSDSIDLYASFYLKAPQGNWVLAGIEEDGITIYLGDDIRRIFFDTPLTSADDMHLTLVRMARTARTGLELPGAAE
ncbi:MAG: HugZ family protein [Hyphomicrobiales bacterium]|nr:MAG: HugZ family protein [Hyphomicrobiales bacterium]